MKPILKPTTWPLIVCVWLSLHCVASAELPQVAWKAVEILELHGAEVSYNDDGFVEKVNLTGFPEEFSVGELAVFPQLETLYCESRYSFQDSQMIGIRKLTNLKTFAINNCRYATNGVLELLAEAPALERVEIENCGEIRNLHGLTRIRHLKELKITPDDSLSFRPLIECRSLETLELEDASIVDDATLKDIGRAKTLKSITLSGLQITDEGLAELGKLPNLEKLSLSSCDKITGDGFAAFEYPESMKDLNLEYAGQLSDQGLKELSRFTNLEHLRMLENKKIKGEGFECLAAMKKLKTLSCPDTAIADEHLALLNGIETLEKIWLHDCPAISGRGLDHLSQSINCESMSLNECRNIDSPDFEIITKFKNLKQLYLASTRIRPDGIERLCQLKQLEELNLGGNAWLDDSAIEKLQHCTVKELVLDALPRLTDRCFKFIGKMPNLVDLSISANQNLNGNGLVAFADNERFKELYIEQPKHLSLMGFSQIAKIPNLEKLELRSGEVTIAQLEQLAGMSKLNQFQYNMDNANRSSERMVSLLRSFPKLDSD